MRSSAALAAALLAFATPASATFPDVATLPPPLPARFIHDQVWLTPRLGGRELRIFTDTGGGWNAFDAALAQSLALPTIEADIDGNKAELIDVPRFDGDTTIPPPPAHFMEGRLMLVERGRLGDRDGSFGGRWFADGRWLFDYAAGTLHRLETTTAPPDCGIPLGFQTNDAGHRTMHFPSMMITVDGEPLDVLLDTGATATLTETSAPHFDLPPGTDVGTSFIEHAVFERWTTRHPDWRVLDAADRKGDQLRRMIEVPRITIDGHAVGPVWFAEQPPGSFQKYMAGMMDRPTWGAIGGSALRYFRMLLDYPAARACFEPL